MKLAEALQERADLNTRIAQLRARLVSNALVQEGEHTAEEPAVLRREMTACLDRLEELMARINRTNCAVQTPEGSLTELLARRDRLNLELQSLRALAQEASCTAQRATRSEIRIRSAVDVPALQKEIDGISAGLRRTDNVIQAANWSEELQ